MPKVRKVYAHRPAAIKRRSDEPILSVPRDVAVKLRARRKFESVWDAREKIRDAIRWLNSERPIEAQLALTEVQAIVRGYK